MLLEGQLVWECFKAPQLVLGGNVWTPEFSPEGGILLTESPKLR